MIHEWPPGDLEYLLNLSAAQASFGQQLVFSSAIKSSGDPIGPAPTVDSVNTGSSSEAPKEPPVTAQPEVMAEFNQIAAATLNTTPSSPRACPLGLALFHPTNPALLPIPSHLNRHLSQLDPNPNPPFLTEPDPTLQFSL
ncbi:cytochrome P450 [Striga asiatica]|uniref:Cytochrome P450 n=1 Tax=Striga asiatica TaxID=4170 RepID=A0A5A7PTJ3_STRAF|nr:cytochrome P450 [Striga asiatica]